MKLKNLMNGNAFTVIHIKNVRFFLAYRFMMTSAILMQSVIVSWQLYDLTKNVFSLGLIGLTEVIPQISIALFAGHFADIWDRKKIITYATLLLLIGSSILLVYSIPSLHCFQRFGTIPIYITVFLTGLVRGILSPAQTAFLGQLVKRELLTSAATWNSTVWQVAAVSGPAVGGLIYGNAGIVPAYTTGFVVFLSSILILLGVHSKSRFVIENKSESIFSRIREGLHFVYHHQVLLGAFSLDMFAVLFGGAVAMLPVFASDILKVGPQGLGILRSAPAIGAILMSTVLTFYPPLKKTGHYFLLCTTGFGISMIAFAFSRNFALSVSVLLLSGAFDNMSVVIRGSILQLFTPDEMRGRVAAVHSIFVGSSNELGAFESGVTAKIMGLIPSVVFGGVMTLFVVATAAKKAPALRKLSLIDSV